MKILLTAILISYTAIAQGNFTVEQNSITWKKVYTTANINNVNSYLKIKGFNITDDGNIIEFEKEFITKNFDAYGYKRSNFPTFFNDGFYSGIIEFKENKYRVTVNKIETTNALTLDTTNNISDFIIKNNEIKTNKATQKVIQVLDLYFTDMFTIKKSDNW